MNERTCVACGKKRQKSELIRIVKSNNEISVDIDGKKPGRGAYICKDILCVQKLEKNSKRFEKNLKIKPTDELIENIRGVIVD